MKGTILRGSLSGGLEVRLDIGENIEEIKVGTFCVVEGRTHDFFSMVVDEDIEAANPRAFYDNHSDNPLINEIIRGTGIIDKVKIQPMIAINREENRIQPVKSIPSYLSVVREAREEDVFKIFGRPDRTNFYVGSPLDMEHIPVCIDSKIYREIKRYIWQVRNRKDFLYPLDAVRYDKKRIMQYPGV